jgi:WD40 repeat protein
MTKTISSSPAAVKKTTTTKAKTKAGTLSPSSTTTATTLHTPTKEQPAVTPLKEYQFSSAVYALAASKDALFAAGKDEIVTQWSINNQSIPKTDYPIDDWVYAMTTTGNSTTTAAGGLFVAVSNIFIVSFEIGSIVSTGEIQISDNLITYALVQTGDYLISGHQNGAVIQWRIDSGEQVRLLAKHESFVSALAVNGDFVFSAGEDAKLIQLSITSGKIIKTLLNSNNAPYYSVCSIGNYVFAAGDPNFGIFQWRLSDGRLLTSFIGHDNWINFLLASDGYLFSASSDYLVKQWQISTGKCVRDFVGHTDIVYTLALNGHYLFSGSEDSTVKQWLIPELKPHMLSISPTATTTSTGSGRNNNGTFVLDLKTGLIIGGVSLIVSISAAVMVYVWRRKHNAKLQKKPVGQSALSLFGSSIQMVPYNNQHHNTVNLGTNSTSTSRSFPVYSTATLDKYASTSRNKMG